MIERENLKEKEFYLMSNSSTFPIDDTWIICYKHEEINLKYETFSKGRYCHDYKYFKKASLEHKNWLKACIKKDCKIPFKETQQLDNYEMY